MQPVRYGLGFRSPHYDEILETRPQQIDWFEIISENFFAEGGRPRQYLARLRDLYPVACHGVGLSIGTESELNYRYLDRLKNLIDFVDPMWVTDHLCWTGYNRVNSFDLLPVRLDQRALDHVSRRVERVQRYLGRSIALENPSVYVAFKDEDYAEAEFLQTLCDRTGCGLLLDLNNLFVNHKNVGLDPKAYLERLDAGAVWQFHMAGHSEGPGGIRIDTHDHPLYAEELELLEIASAKFKNAPILLEWDDKIPALQVLIDELAKIKAHDRGAAGWVVRTQPRVRDFDLRAGDFSEPSYQDQFLSLVLKPKGVDDDLGLFAEQSPEFGIQVYNQAFYLRIRDVMKNLLPATAFIAGENFDELVARYLVRHAPQAETIDNCADRFARFLHERGSVPEGLESDREIFAEVAQFETHLHELFTADNASGSVHARMFDDFEEDDWARLRIFFAPAVAIEAFAYPISEVVVAARKGDAPEKPQLRPTFYIFTRPEFAVEWRDLDELEFQFLTKLRETKSLFQSCQSVFDENNFDLSFAEFVQKALACVFRLLGTGAIERIDLKGDVLSESREVAETSSSSGVPYDLSL